MEGTLMYLQVKWVIVRDVQMCFGEVICNGGAECGSRHVQSIMNRQCWSGLHSLQLKHLRSIDSQADWVSVLMPSLLLPPVFSHVYTCKISFQQGHLLHTISP